MLLCGVFVSCFASVWNPEFSAQLDLDDRQGFIASSAMQQKKNGCFGLPMPPHKGHQAQPAAHPFPHHVQRAPRRQGYNCNLGTRDFLVAGPVGRRQGYNCNLGTRDFLVAGPVGRRQGCNCNLGTRVFFWWQAQLEGDRAATAIWELAGFFGGRPSWKATGLQLQSGNLCFFGGRPSWKAIGLQLQSGNSRFFGGRPSWKATGL